MSTESNTDQTIRYVRDLQDRARERARKAVEPVLRQAASAFTDGLQRQFWPIADHTLDLKIQELVQELVAQLEPAAIDMVAGFEMRRTILEIDRMLAEGA